MENTVLKDLAGNILDPHVPRYEIVEADYSDNGYVRFSNGFQFAWMIKRNQDLGGNAWGSSNQDISTKVWYSDHKLGNWLKPFTSILLSHSFANSVQIWTGTQDVTNTSSGTIRAYHSNQNVVNADVGIFAFGKWK